MLGLGPLLGRLLGPLFGPLRGLLLGQLFRSSSRPFLGPLFRPLFSIVFVLGVLLIAAAYLEFRFRDLAPRTQRTLVVERGMRSIDIVEHAQSRALAPARLSWVFARMHFGSSAFKAGVYDLLPGSSLYQLLLAMQSDQGRKLYWQVLEGQTLDQVRLGVHGLPFLRKEVEALSTPELLERLRAHSEGAAPTPHGEAEQADTLRRFVETHRLDFLEGLLYPDRYRYVPGMTDLELLASARKRQLLLLAQTWDRRPEDYPLHSARDLLALASLIEKETGRAEDRQRVAAVFLNRIRLGMRLQSDPTVIYGQSQRDPRAPITRSELKTDHPFNTYTRFGLPPTPIAIPGVASLDAAVTPSAERSLYFVARGDGSSEFSETLKAHNAAVERYLRAPKRSANDVGQRL